MDNKNYTESDHKIILTDRKTLIVSGVEDVESFDDDTVIAYTVCGIITVKGSDFSINRLSVDSGELEIHGEIDNIAYSEGGKNSGGFWGKIFK